MSDPHTDDEGYAIRASGFTFQYPTGDEAALEDLSVAVEPGEVLGVVGPVEAGKTSLSMALSGFVPSVTGGHSEGDLSVAGRDPRGASDDRVAMVFEDYSAQLTQLRVIDELTAPLTNRGVDREAALERARELLDLVGLDEPEDRFTWELSGGQQQRLAIAAALAIDPEVLVFDTATDMLDPAGREDVTDLIASLAGETTLVVTENDPDRLVGIADRLLVLDDGRRVAFGDADDLLRDADLLESIGVAAPTALEIARRAGLAGDPIDPGEFYEACATRLDRSLPEPEAAWTSRDDARVAGDPDEGADPAPDGGSERAGPPSAAAHDPATSDPTAEFGDPVIVADGVTFEYPDGTVAVEDVDLTVHEGEVHAVIGGNGAGKSTLTKLLVGLMTPTEGTVTVAGTDTAESAARWTSESVGIALQNPDEQLSEDTVDEELRYPLAQRRYERTGPLGLFGKRERYGEAHIDERVAAVRELVGIDDDLRDADPVFLPRGERRQVTMAAALAPDPEGVVLDEPAAGIDASADRTLRQAVEQLRDQETAVMVVDHDMAFVCAVADRVTVLADGEVAMQGPTEAVFARNNWDWLVEHHMQPPLAARLARRVGVAGLTTDEVVAAVEGAR